jgi:hypothetical protein
MRRIVPWGKPMSNIGLSFLKAVGIRIHTVRYQKIRKRLVKQHDNDETGDDDDNEKMTSKENNRIRGTLTIHVRFSLWICVRVENISL